MPADLNSYFEAYGAAVFDAEKVEGFYDDFAVTSGPTFVGCLKGHDEIRKAFSQIAGYQRQTGLKWMRPADVQEIEIDDLHLLAKVQWNAAFEKTGDKPVSFDVSYLLRKEGESWKILLYISHQDEMKMRQELGIA